MQWCGLALFHASNVFGGGAAVDGWLAWMVVANRPVGYWFFGNVCFADNGIGAKGTTALAEALKQNSTIHTLHLQSMPLMPSVFWMEVGHRSI